MPTLTPILGLVQPVDADNAEAYLTGSNSFLGGGLTGTLLALDASVVTAKATPKNNTTSVVQLKHPDATASGFDTTPLAALYVATPDSSVTRADVCGIWVETNGATLGKGRGVHVNNTGQSYGFYAAQNAVGSSGAGLGSGGAGVGAGCIGDYSVGLNAAVYAPHAVGLWLQQVTGGGSATLAQIDGYVAGAADLVTVNSNLSSGGTKNGLVFRMASQAGNVALRVKAVDGATDIFSVAADTGEMLIKPPNNSPALAITTNGTNPGGVGASVSVTDTGGEGATLKLSGNTGSGTPSKTLQVVGGTLYVVNDAFTATLLSVTDVGNLAIAGGLTVPGAILQTGANDLTTGRDLYVGRNISFPNVSTFTGATAGAASALPSAPAGYVQITIGGVNYKYPVYNP